MTSEPETAPTPRKFSEDAGKARTKSFDIVLLALRRTLWKLMISFAIFMFAATGMYFSAILYSRLSSVVSVSRSSPDLLVSQACRSTVLSWPREAAEQMGKWRCCSAGLLNCGVRSRGDPAIAGCRASGEHPSRAIPCDWVYRNAKD